MSAALYTDTHGAGSASELVGMELRKMIAGGADAVKKAATAKNVPEYFLDVVYGNYDESKRTLRVRVRPSVLGGSTAVHADVLGADFELRVTAVYDALAATPTATRLDLGSLVEGEYAAITRLINARSSTGEVALFVSGSGRLTVFAVRAVLRALSDLGVGGERTLMVHDTGLNLGSELYYSSTVRIGTVGDALIAPSIDRADREQVRTLFEGGEWAFQKEAEDAPARSIRVEGTPELRIGLNVRTRWRNIGDRSRTAPHVFVRGDGTDLNLLVISNTWDVVDVLSVTRDWDITQGFRAIDLMNEYEKARGMTILAWATKEDTDVRASSWRSALSRVLRALYDLKLTAQEANTDALMIVRDGEGKQEASRLLSWITVTAGVARVMQREIGLKNRVPKRRSAQKKRSAERP